MKTAQISVKYGEHTDHFMAVEIDITHLRLVRLKKPSDTPTPEQIQRASAWHVMQFIETPPLYNALWDWLRGLREIDGMTIDSEEE